MLLDEPGYVGTLTAVKPGGFSVTVNTRRERLMLILGYGSCFGHPGLRANNFDPGFTAALATIPKIFDL